jgi:hypothetical protein
MTIHKSQSLTLHKAVVYLSNVFASRQAYVALSRVRTKNDLFIKDWNLQGLLNVKHVIRTRLTKESEDARTAIDDKIDEMEERMADGSRTEVGGWNHRRGKHVESWEKKFGMFARGMPIKRTIVIIERPIKTVILNLMGPQCRRLTEALRMNRMRNRCQERLRSLNHALGLSVVEIAS